MKLRRKRVVYYVNENSQTNGDHEVHKRSCEYFPDEENAIKLGEFYSCHNAVSEAIRLNYQANGCYYCSRECHTG